MLLNLLRPQFNIEIISLLMCLFITFHNYQLKVVYHLIIYCLTFRMERFRNAQPSSSVGGTQVDSAVIASGSSGHPQRSALLPVAACRKRGR